jgi:acyl dehydratase
VAAVAVDTSTIGKTYPAVSYSVGREKVREFAYAVGETNPVYFDVEAARAAGYDDVVAPPMFAVVYSGRAVWPAVHDPEVGLDFSMLVHGAQEFEWGPVVVAGDEISTEARIKDISERGGMGFYIFESVSKNQRAETVCTGLWTDIVRGT